ncbi:MAG TPA: hypothetical protein VLF62_02710 [Candidatus Saccharimonadales bacterium]|nr:hypothetical protein [Candidatus Saccharimonadales bacterium]
MDMDYDFSGIWTSTYYYTSTRRGPGEYQSTHQMMGQRRGNHVVFESLPNDEGSFLLIRLKLDGRLANGGWEETSSPTGAFKGARFYGPVQLVLDEDGKAFRGLSLVTGRDMKVKTNRWEIVHRAQSPTRVEAA